MDKNTVIGLLLIGAILFGFSWLNQPTEEELENRAKTEAIQQQKVENTQPINIDTANNVVNTNQADSSYNVLPIYMQEQEEKLVTLKNDLLEVKISNKGGMPVFAHLLKYKDNNGKGVELFSKPGDIDINLPLRTNQNSIINTADSYFTLHSSTDSTAVMRMQFSESSYLDITYILPKDDYRMKMKLSGENLESILPSNMSLQDIEWKQKIRQQETSWKFELQYSGIYYHFTSGDIDSQDLSSDKTERVGERVNWFAFKDKYFSTLLLIDEGAFDDSKILSSPLDEGSGYVGKCQYTGSFPFNIREKASASFTWLLAPNDYELLSSYSDTTIEGKDLKFQHLVYLGISLFRAINKYLIIPVVLFLNKYISNWGIIILLLTLFIKLLLSPLTYKSYLSQAKMRVLKPEVEEIKNKYPGKDKESMMKRQTETMNLYRSAGASPMSGCLPMLFQMPFFIALYMYFPTSILIRGESFLWVEDLSTYDAIIHWSGNIPLIGNHISIMCLLMTITNIVYNKYMMSQNSTGQEGMPSMKWMPYIMSIMFFFMFNSNAAGLCYYYFISSLITIIQYFGFRYAINEKKLLAKMEENKKKPKKKSGFMKRLEEAQRMQREMQKKKNKNR